MTLERGAAREAHFAAVCAPQAAVYSTEGHAHTARALTELAFSMGNQNMHYLHCLVARLWEPRNAAQRWPLQLINAMVNSPDEMEERVTPRVLP